jgi:hypothetical protein
MNARTIEDIADRVVEQVKLADRLLDEQFEGMGPGLTEVNDELFYALFMMRMAEYGPDYARALDAKKEDGTDLVPGGRNMLRRFMRVKTQREMAEMSAMWAPEPYEEDGDDG